MKLVEFVPPVKHPLWKLCLQMGITEVIVKVNPDLTGLPDPWKYDTLKKIVDGLATEGLTVVGLEGDPFDMSPVKQFGEEGITPEMRDETISHYRELLESMGRLGIKLLCYNFMVGTGWARTGVREGRGNVLFACGDSPGAAQADKGSGLGKLRAFHQVRDADGREVRCPHGPSSRRSVPAGAWRLCEDSRDGCRLRPGVFDISLRIERRHILPGELQADGRGSGGDRASFRQADLICPCAGR